MKLPGEALLEFRVEPLGPGQCTLSQVALFKPLGLGGLVYWYAVVPLHHIVFRGMLRGIHQAALQIAAATPPELEGSVVSDLQRGARSPID